jgi:hypothetical protein
VRVTHLACSFANPLWTCTEDGMPGKRDELRFSRNKLASVASASLQSSRLEPHNLAEAKNNIRLGRVGSLMGNNNCI